MKIMIYIKVNNGIETIRQLGIYKLGSNVLLKSIISIFVKKLQSIHYLNLLIICEMSFYISLFRKISQVSVLL